MSVENRGEAFLSRWSRLKREQAPERKEERPAADGQVKPAEDAAAAPEKPAEPLPDVQSLSPDSDFKPFMAPEVDPATRREALKKLFTDAHFNIPDPYEAYSEDYTQSEDIPEAMLKTLNQARRVLTQDKEPAAAAPEAAPDPAAGAPSSSQDPTQEFKDVAGRQDA